MIELLSNCKNSTELSAQRQRRGSALQKSNPKLMISRECIYKSIRCCTATLSGSTIQKQAQEKAVNRSFYMFQSARKRHIATASPVTQYRRTMLGKVNEPQVINSSAEDQLGNPNGIKHVYDAASDPKRLPPAFKEVAIRIPLVNNTL